MAISVFTVTMTSGQTQPTSGVDLGDFGWERIAMVFPSSPSGNVGMTVSDTIDGTYYRVADVQAASSPALVNATVDSSVVANGCVAVFPGGYRFVKPWNTSGVTDTVKTIKIICAT